MAIQEVNTESMNALMLKSLPLLVDFYATWCGPCKALSPILDELSTEYEGEMRFAKMNIDTSKEAAIKYGIMAVPTMIIFKDGKEHTKIVGMKTKTLLRQEIDKVVLP